MESEGNPSRWDRSSRPTERKCAKAQSLEETPSRGLRRPGHRRTTLPRTDTDGCRCGRSPPPRLGKPPADATPANNTPNRTNSPAEPAWVLHRHRGRVRDSRRLRFRVYRESSAVGGSSGSGIAYLPDEAPARKYAPAAPERGRRRRRRLEAWRGGVGVSPSPGTNWTLDRGSVQVLAASTRIPGAIPAWVRARARGPTAAVRTPSAAPAQAWAWAEGSPRTWATARGSAASARHSGVTPARASATAHVLDAAPARAWASAQRPGMPRASAWAREPAGARESARACALARPQTRGLVRAQGLAHAQARGSPRARARGLAAWVWGLGLARGGGWGRSRSSRRGVWRR